MKPITLHPHEIRRLIDTGSVTVWRPIDRIGRHGKVAQFGPSDTPGYEWHFRCKRGLWQDYRDAELIKVAPHPPGSERWVRETWSYYCDYESLFDCIRYKTDGACRKPDFHRFANVSENTWYRFSMLCDGCGCKDHSWRSPVTMPRWASRLSVTVAGVEVRQVQGVTEDECWESGVYRIGPELETPLPVVACEEPQVKEGMAFGYQEKPFVGYAGNPRKAFMFLWDGRHNPRGYCPEDAPQGWDANPWAWATTLTRKNEG